MTSLQGYHQKIRTSSLAVNFLVSQVMELHRPLNCQSCWFPCCLQVKMRSVLTSSFVSLKWFSSPHAKRAGPKGLRAESARAVTGRRCPHSGEGEDFLSHQPDFFTKTAVTPERRVEKSIPRWEMNGLSEGYKWVIDQNWGRVAKIGSFGQKPRFRAQRKCYTFGD